MSESRSFITHFFGDFLKDSIGIKANVTGLKLQGMTLIVKDCQEAKAVFTLRCDQGTTRISKKMMRARGEVRLQGAEEDTLYVLQGLTWNFKKNEFRTRKNFYIIINNETKEIDRAQLHNTIMDILPKEAELLFQHF